MHESLRRGLTCGFIGNLFFIIFAIVCYIYYVTYKIGSGLSNFLEVVAYTIEGVGFFFLVVAMIEINRSVRMRPYLKISFPIYTAIELILMIFELNSYQLSFYKPYSLALAIVHAVVSAAVCFTFLSLDPSRTCLEVAVTICVGVILGGMLGNIAGIRIYFSILTNAIAFAGLFWIIKWFYKREMIEIDCHGDQARVLEADSKFF